MIVYAIRHKATQKFMPLFKKNKGYSHWNPAVVDKEIAAKETGTIRIFAKELSAKLAIAQWYSNPNAEYRGYTSYSGEDDYDLRVKSDGREKEDLEVVHFKLEELKGLAK